MFPFERISVKQISFFSEVLFGSSLLQREFLRQRYSAGASNFAETVDFLLGVELIEIKEDRVLPRARYTAFWDQVRKALHPERTVRELIIDNLIAKRTQYSKQLEGFLFQFHLEDGRWKCAPGSAQRLKFSGLRNLLIDLGFLYLDSETDKYVVADDYFLVYSLFRESRGLSPDEFLLLRKRKELIGKAAELEIVKYEKDRLSDFPHLIEKIEHTALKDVRAGYDVKSFDGNPDRDGPSIPRYIEVKAVSLSDYRFYWTRNEIDKATIYRHRYCLYLLPAVNEESFRLDSLKIVRDPYLNVYESAGEWKRAEEVVVFSLCESSDDSDSKAPKKPLDQGA